MSRCNAACMTTTSPQVKDDALHDIALTEIELCDSYPDVPPDMIHTLTQQTYSRMIPAKVHGYLHILVGREVRDPLDAQPAA